MKHVPFSKFPTTKTTWKDFPELKVVQHPIIGQIVVGRNEKEIDYEKLIGIEYELNLYVSPRKASKIVKFILEQRPKETITNYRQLLAFFGKEIATWSEIWNIEIDEENNIEIVTYPMTLTAHRVLSIEYQYYIDILLSYGFTTASRQDGIHTNVNVDVFGTGLHEQKETLDKLMLFYFFENDFICDFSGREYHQEIMVDVYHLLGDTFQLNSKEFNLSEFRFNKKLFTDSFYRKVSHKFCNVHVFKEKRNAVEIRWFASTEKVERLLAIIEFIFALISFCKINTEENLNLKKFFSFVFENSDIYGNLMTDLYVRNYFTN
jgi:hypothetical protein